MNMTAEEKRYIAGVTNPEFIELFHYLRVYDFENPNVLNVRPDHCCEVEDFFYTLELVVALKSGKNINFTCLSQEAVNVFLKDSLFYVSNQRLVITVENRPQELALAIKQVLLMMGI